MAKDISLSVTRADDGEIILIGDTAITLMVWDTLGSRILYNDNGANIKEVVVTNTNAAVAAMSEVLISLTDVASGSTIYFNANRFLNAGDATISVGADTLGTVFNYDDGFNRKTYTVTEDVSVVFGKLS